MSKRTNPRGTIRPVIPTAPAPTALQPVLREFTAWGVNERRWRPATCYSYAGVVRRADDFIRAEELSVSMTRALDEHYRAFLWSLPNTASSRHLATKALRAFGDFLVATGRRRNSPAETLPRFKPERGVPKALEAEQAGAIIRAARRQGTQWDAMVLLMFYAGLRISEVRLLCWEEVEGRWLRVDGKGGVERMVPLHPRPWAALRRLEGEGITSPYVFASPRIRDRPISANTIWNHIRQAGDEAGVDGMHAHLARHTFATLLLEQTSDLRLVQDAMGHASAATTQIYTKVRPERMRDAVTALSI